jgi:hypothetical protein
MSKPCNIRPDPGLPVVKAITAGWLQLFRKHSMTLRGAAKPEQTDAQIFSFGYSGKMMHCCYLRLSGSAAYKQLFAAPDPEVNIAACERRMLVGWLIEAECNKKSFSRISCGSRQSASCVRCRTSALYEAAFIGIAWNPVIKGWHFQPSSTLPTFSLASGVMPAIASLNRAAIAA